MTTKKRMMLKGLLHEVWEATEYRDGCVYGAERVPEYVACRSSEPCLLEGGRATLASPGTDDVRRTMEGG